MILASQAKHCILRHYVLISTVLFGLAVAALASSATAADLPTKLTILGAPFAFVLVFQKQRLEEVQMFKQLFHEFNRRYDRLNERLNRIRERKDAAALEDDEKDTLYDYFNLCGEEYLFYRLGYIPREVWETWHKGMLIFYQSPRLKQLWDKDLATGSYYGLRLRLPTAAPSPSLP